MIDWLTAFYRSDDLRAQLVESFRPVFFAYASAVVDNPSPEFIASLIERFVERYLDSSRAQLQEVVNRTIDEGGDPLAALEQRFSEWVEKRPIKVRQNEIVRTANATRLQDMRDRQVLKKVWVTSGKNCPYCTSLDGKVIGVEEVFFNADDEIQPPGAERALRFNSDKAHPPIHHGCDCSIAEYTETA